MQHGTAGAFPATRITVAKEIVNNITVQEVQVAGF